MIFKRNRRFRVFLSCVGALLLALPSSVAGNADAPEDDAENTPRRAERWKDEVVVTAAADGPDTTPVGWNYTTLQPEEAPGAPSALTDLLVSQPGVSENGQGGLFQVFSIRGVSRQRVLSQVSSARIVSDRRAGTSVSFVEPLLLSSA